MTEAFIGFDSAWADNPKVPGAVSAVIRDSDGSSRFIKPQCASFSKAEEFIDAVSKDACYTLVAIDQPTIVPNQFGYRPVERVAQTVVCKLNSGVQPARTTGSGEALFGPASPVMGFLGRLGAKQSPELARVSRQGKFLVEVYPALSLPTLVPEIWKRGQAARYNPSKPNFGLVDWQMVCSGLSLYARSLNALEVAAWLDNSSFLTVPQKSDQDQLDAVICALLALGFRTDDKGSYLHIGDEQHGYMVAAAGSEIKQLLQDAATKHSVGINQSWENTDHIDQNFSSEYIKSKIERPQNLSDGAPRPAIIDQTVLRTILVSHAKLHKTITYAELWASLGGGRWTQGAASALTTAFKSVECPKPGDGGAATRRPRRQQEDRIAGRWIFDRRIGAGTVRRSFADVSRRL